MELLSVLHQAKRTIIYVSNDPLVMSACDRVVILADGKIKSADTMDNLMKNNLVNDLIS
jgi:ABC-type bacteriocin/lantibiotic exporter with double-glycine peptidase domain